MERSASLNLQQDSPMVDEMFDAGTEMEMAMEEGAAVQQANSANQPGTTPAQTMMQELNASERTVHADFTKSFGLDLFDDADLK